MPLRFSSQPRPSPLVSSDRGSVPKAAFAKDLAGNYDETRWHKHGPRTFFPHQNFLEVPYPKSEGDVFQCQMEDSFGVFFVCVVYPAAYDGYVYDTET